MQLQAFSAKMKTEYNLRKELIEICRRIYQKGLISATDGNVSIKISDNRILFTPSGVCKGFIEADDLIVTDSKGNKISGKGLPTSEIFMHLAAYQERNDIKAVVHAHPPTTVALTFSGIDISECLLPEVIISLGTIPTIPYQTTGTMDLASSIIPYVRIYDAMILEKHGSLTVGTDVSEAYYKLEKIEHNAQVFFMSLQMGRIFPLNSEQKAKLLTLRKK